MNRLPRRQSLQLIPAVCHLGAEPTLPTTVTPLAGLLVKMLMPGLEAKGVIVTICVGLLTAR